MWPDLKKNIKSIRFFQEINYELNVEKYCFGRSSKFIGQSPEGNVNIRTFSKNFTSSACHLPVLFDHREVKNDREALCLKY
jgi:hypothetical protein